MKLEDLSEKIRVRNIFEEVYIPHAASPPLIFSITLQPNRDRIPAHGSYPPDSVKGVYFTIDMTAPNAVLHLRTRTQRDCYYFELLFFSSLLPDASLALPIQHELLEYDSQREIVPGGVRQERMSIPVLNSFMTSLLTISAIRKNLYEPPGP